MKPVMFLLFLFLAFAAMARGQGGTATRVRSASALPPTCQPGDPNGAADTIIVNNIGYACIQLNTWSFVPWLDVTLYGAVPESTNGYPTMTATCTSGSQTLTSVSNDNYGTYYGFFINGGVNLIGCGATNTMSTPGAPTVTPSGTWGMAETQSPVTVANGRSTYAYKIIARDTGGGLTLPSTATTITTGLASLGLQTAKISTLSRSNDQVTLTLAAAPESPLVVGDLIDINPTNSPQFSGWYNVAVVKSSTQVVIYSTSIDTRAQGWMNGDTTSYSGGGTIGFYRMNYLTWTPVTGAWEYYVCAKRPRDTNYHLIGTTRPSGASGYIDASFEDYGSPYLDLQTYPPYVQTAAEQTHNNNATNIANHTTSNAVCTASAATNDNLSTYITAHSASNGNYTIAIAASHTLNGTAGYYDNAPGIRRAIAAAQAAPGTGLNGPFKGAIYFPPSYYPYLVQSFLAIPSGITVWQSGSITANDTIQLFGSINWTGDLGNEGPPQFGFNSGSSINSLYGTPAVYAYGAGLTMRKVNIHSINANGVVAMVSDSGSVTFDQVNFATGSASTDYAGMDLILRGIGSIQQVFFQNTSFNAGPTQTLDMSWTPGLWVAPGQNRANVGFGITMSSTAYYLRGIAFGGAGETGTYGNTGTCPVNAFTNRYSYRQAGIMPHAAVQGCPAYTTFTFNDTFQDTEGQPLQANLNKSPASTSLGSRLIAYNVSGGAGNPVVSGLRSSFLDLKANFSSAHSFQNRDFSWDVSTLNMVVSPYATTGSYNATAGNSLRTVGMAMHGVGGYSWWFDLTIPSRVMATASGSGNVPSGTYVYGVSSTGADGGESIVSAVSSSVSPNGSQGVVASWTNGVGAFSSNVYRCVVLTGNCTNGDGSTNVNGLWYRVAQHVTGGTYRDTAASPTQVVLPAASGTGSTIMNASLIRAPTVAGDSVTTGDARAFGSGSVATSSACETNYGATTLSTGGTTTNTGLNCLPANAIIDSVVYRIMTTITTATSFTIGDSTSAARFCSTQSTLTTGTTGICIAQAGSASEQQAFTASVRVTTNSNPGAGAIRLIVYYHTFTPPSS
jgi:hypothetical protein